MNTPTFTQASINISDMAQTWNAGATTFTAIKMNVTDTASAAGSSLLDLQVGGVSRFFVRKDGFAGFGTSSPGARLHVLGGNARVQATSDGSNGVIQVQDTAASTLLQIYNDSTKANIAVVESKPMLFYTTNLERMRLDAGGNLGLGISVPLARLDVNGGIRTSAGSGGMLALFDNDPVRNNRFAAGADATGAYIDSTFSSGGTGAINFRTIGTARWQFTTAGDLLPAAANTYNIGSSSFTVASVNAVNLRVASTLGALTFGASNDVFVVRDAADVLAQRNGVNAQSFRVYNTFTDASNYERGFFRYVSNALEIGHEGLGTGAVTPRTVSLWANGTRHFTVGGDTGAWNINNSNNLVCGIDNTRDIGASGASRPRNLYMGSWIRMATTVVASLPAAATAGAGARMFVTDALTPVFGSAVTGGGAVTVPVYSTGSAWNVG